MVVNTEQADISLPGVADLLLLRRGLIGASRRRER
jgi:hypothetical protein